jgi:hypothetical protein
MSNDRSGTLAAPHACVAIAVTQQSGTRFAVEDTGTPAQLVAAGIVNEQMQEKILSQRSGVMIDSDGDAFKIQGKFGETKRATWEAASRCTLTYYRIGSAAVLCLPGVAALFPSGLEVEERSALNAQIEQLGQVVRVMREVEEGGGMQRCRIIGRKRREATWYALDDVLYVNWAAIVRDRILARV